MNILALLAGAALAQATPVAPAANTKAVCAQGKVTALTYRGFRDGSDHDPNMIATVNGKTIYIGLNADTNKSRMGFSDMRSTLLSAMLAGSNVVIQYNGSSCPAHPTDDKIEITVSVPTPRAPAPSELPEVD